MIYFCRALLSTENGAARHILMKSVSRSVRKTFSPSGSQSVKEVKFRSSVPPNQRKANQLVACLPAFFFRCSERQLV